MSPSCLRRVAALFLSLLGLAGGAMAESTGPAFETGKLVKGVACQSDPTQTYSLYLPSAYSPETKWPALLIFDPRGRSVTAAELFREAAEEYGWIILSSNDTRSDGPMEPNNKALSALWPEVNTRYATDPRRIYAAGFSGGAMLAWAFGREHGSLAGVIGSGGRLEASNLNQKIDFPSFGAAGDIDFNHVPMQRVHSRLRSWGTPERLEIFKGPHRWMPAELARLGVEWLELQAMKQGLRERDDALIEKLFQKDASKALELQTAGDGLAAKRRYDAVVATFSGLRDVATAEASAARLAKRKEVQEALLEEKRWNAWAASNWLRMQGVLPRIASDPALTHTKLVGELHLKSIQKSSKKPSFEGVAARRLLEALLVQASFYLPRELTESGNHRAAVKALRLATRIRPKRGHIWYDLARAWTRAGNRKKAVEALTKVLDLGYADREKIAADPELTELHRYGPYKQLMAGPEDS